MAAQRFAILIRQARAGARAQVIQALGRAATLGPARAATPARVREREVIQESARGQERELAVTRAQGLGLVPAPAPAPASARAREPEPVQERGAVPAALVWEPVLAQAPAAQA